MTLQYDICICGCNWMCVCVLKGPSAKGKIMGCNGDEAYTRFLSIFLFIPPLVRFLHSLSHRRACNVSLSDWRATCYSVNTSPWAAGEGKSSCRMRRSQRQDLKSERAGEDFIFQPDLSPSRILKYIMPVCSLLLNDNNLLIHLAFFFFFWRFKNPTSSFQLVGDRSLHPQQHAEAKIKK